MADRFDTPWDKAWRGSKYGYTRELLDVLDPAAPTSAVCVALNELGEVHDHPEVVPRIVAHLAVDQRPPVQSSGIRALGKLGDSRGVEAAGTGLTPAGRKWRTEALGALTAIGGPAAVGVLRDALADAGWIGHGDIAQALGRIASPDAVAALRFGLADSKPARRIEILRGLEGAATADAVVVLSEAATDTDVGVVSRAAQALAAIGSADALLALECLLAETHAHVSRRRRLNRLLLDRAEDLRDADRFGSWSELRRAREDHDVVELAGLLDPERDATFVAWVARALAAVGTADAVPALINHLHVEVRPSPRHVAVKALAAIGDARALPALRGLLCDPAGADDPLLRAAVAETAAAVGGHDADELLSSLRSDPHEFVRARANAGGGR